MQKRGLIFKITLILWLVSFIHAKNNIQVYNAYGNSHKVIIEGRMVYKKNYNQPLEDDTLFHNMWRKIKQLTSNEIKNEKIIAYIGNEICSTIGDDEGYFEFDIKRDQELYTGYNSISLQIENNPNTLNIKAKIISDEAIGIISDFDDTVIISDVTNKFKLINNLLLKNYKQRKVVPTMVERFQKILAQNSPNIPSTLFFVTGSPKQLFNSIERFLNYHHFPKHTLITKQIHGLEMDPLLNQFKYKVERIEELFRLYPKMQWIMFGDSGEKDKEVYEYLFKKYPLKIKSYYIRDINSGKIVRNPI